MGAERKGGVGYVLRKFPVLSETFILNELLALQDRGLPLHVISLERPNDPRFHDDLPKLGCRVNYLLGIADWKRYVRIHRRLFESESVGPRYRALVRKALTGGDGWKMIRFLQAGMVANEVRRLKLEHLHCHFAHYPTTVTHMAAELTDTPFSFTAHATDIFKHEVDRRTLARKMDAARFVVTVSTFNRDYLASMNGADPDKITLVRNGIDMARFRGAEELPPEPFRLICVARLVEKKGLPLLVEACRTLKDRGLDFTCDLVGKGRLRTTLEAQIAEGGLKGTVRLVGPKTQGEVRDLYRSVHAYVLPAIVGSDGNREGLPVSIVEGLACGLPVISTPVTGIPEAVRHEHNGLLVQEGSASALADALERVMRDRALFCRLRANARPSVEVDYDRDRTSAQLHALFTGAAP